MNLISDGALVLIGPGSEWFWSMAQFVIVAITLLGIYFQLRVARSANAFSHFDAFEAEWASERLTRQRLAILEVTRDGRSLDEVAWAVTGLCMFWEKLGALARKRHVDVRLIRSGSGPDCQAWWGTVREWVIEKRAEFDDPTTFEHFEWLSGAMDEQDRRMGVTVIVDESFLAATLERRLAANRGRLEMERSLRSVIVEGSEIDAVLAAPSRPTKRRSRSRSR